MSKPINEFSRSTEISHKNYAKNLYQLSIFQDERRFIFNCAHCDSLALVRKLPGQSMSTGYLFRHGFYKNNFDPLTPQLTSGDIKKLIEEKKICGCGKLFLLKDKTLTQLEP